MKASLERLISIGISFIVISLMFAGISDAQIDPATIDGLWLLDEGVGEIAGDSSGNGRDGTATRTIWVDGKFGKALEFDGKGAKLVINNYSGVGGMNPRTVVFWWKGLNNTSRNSWVKWGVNLSGQKYFIHGYNEVPEVVSIRLDVNGGGLLSNTNVCDEKWHHIAVVLANEPVSVASHTIYIDGKPEEDPQVWGFNMDTNIDTNVVHIGSEIPGIWQNDYAKGIMDEVAILHAALSEADIKTIMTEGFSRALAIEHTDRLATTWAAAKTQY